MCCEWALPLAELPVGKDVAPGITLSLVQVLGDFARHVVAGDAEELPAIRVDS